MDAVGDHNPTVAYRRKGDAMKKDTRENAAWIIFFAIMLHGCMGMVAK